MSEDIRLPKLSPSMREGMLIAWLKREGETVKKGEPLFQVETDKAVMEVESPATGVLERIVKGPGQKVPVDTIIAVIST